MKGILRAATAGLVALVAAGAAALTQPATADTPKAAPAQEAPTIYIASDSTAQTYDESWVPQEGWGQELHQYFTDDVTVANHAIGGRSSRSFIEEGRLDTILNEIQAGDYLFVQFGHNDADYTNDERYTPPEDYKEYLRNDYIAGALERGATPVVVTPVSRRDYDPETGKFNVSFPEYVQAATEVAAEEDVPLLDLSASSRAYLDSIGPEAAKDVFLWTDPGEYPNRPDGTQDDTHFQQHGAIEIARLVATDVAALDLPLADHVTGIDAAAAAPAS